MMKKLLLAGVIAGIFSGAAIAADDTATKTEAKDGVRFNTAIGPFYDPIFDLAGSVIPTLAYEIGDAQKTSVTKLYAIYGSNGNYVGRAESKNYFGADSQWYVNATGNYSYAKLDVMNFMDMAGGPTVEVENVATIMSGTAQYEIFENAYFGPLVSYRTTVFERGGVADYSTAAMITDKEALEYGLALTIDKRDNAQTPTDGFFAEFNTTKQKVENTKGGVIPANPMMPNGMTLNGTSEYYTIKSDLRTYIGLGEKTTLALRQKVIWNGDEAQTSLTPLDKVAHGFTMEIAGRSAAGADAQIRHWLTPRIGVVGMASVAKAIDSPDEDVHYAFGIGGRYMLNQKDKLSMRLDLTYSDQTEDEMLVFFNVGEKF